MLVENLTSVRCAETILGNIIQGDECGVPADEYKKVMAFLDKFRTGLFKKINTETDGE